MRKGLDFVVDKGLCGRNVAKGIDMGWCHEDR